MQAAELISTALADALPYQGIDLVRGVKVMKGWGDILFVTVHSPLRRRDASPSLEDVIRVTVGKMLAGQGHHVMIRWADSI
jgi:hypothetical protein